MFKKNLSRWFFPVFFDKDDEGGGGGTPPPPEPPTEEEKKKQEQKELDKQFAERAVRAAEAERKKILDSLGVKDLDEATALTKAAKEADDKNKSALEKAEAKAKASDEAKEKAESEAKVKLEAADKKLLDSEIKINASAAVTDKDGKVTRPAFRKEALDDVLLLIDRTKIDEKDGAYVNVDKALNDLAKAKPWLLEEKQQTVRGTPRDGTGTRKQDDGERSPIISSL